MATKSTIFSDGPDKSLKVVDIHSAEEVEGAIASPELAIAENAASASESDVSLPDDISPNQAAEILSESTEDGFEAGLAVLNADIDTASELMPKWVSVKETLKSTKKLKDFLKSASDIKERVGNAALSSFETEDYIKLLTRVTEYRDNIKDSIEGTTLEDLINESGIDISIDIGITMYDLEKAAEQLGHKGFIDKYRNMTLPDLLKAIGLRDVLEIAANAGILDIVDEIVDGKELTDKEKQMTIAGLLSGFTYMTSSRRTLDQSEEEVGTKEEQAQELLNALNKINPNWLKYKRDDEEASEMWYLSFASSHAEDALQRLEETRSIVQAYRAFNYRRQSWSQLAASQYKGIYV